MKWRCTNCGHIALGAEAPDKCPVCGVPKEMYEPLEAIEPVAGTETERNLMAALAGESQASRKYLAYAIVAELESHRQAAELFRRRAEEETVHAIAHLIRLGMINSTEENLKATVEGESYENQEMYPSFARQAQTDNAPQTAHYFNSLATVEGKHAEAYREMLEKVRSQPAADGGDPLS